MSHRLFVGTFTSLLLAILLTPLGWADQSIQIKQDDESLSIAQADSPILMYRFGKVPFKPYVEKLYSPQGINVARDQVEDHPHHHGLMFALRVNGISFWGETEEAGKQIHQGFGALQSKQDEEGLFAQIKERLHWQSPEKETLLKESRTLQLIQPQGQKVNLLSWRSQLQCPQERDEVILAGSHYYGLGIRFIEKMDAIGSFLNSEGAEGTIFRGEERLVEADWCGYQVKAPSPITVVFFASPKNPHSTTWFTMANPFAYLSATLRYHENEYTITPSQPLDLRYTVGVWDGLPDRKAINQFYDEWKH